MKSSNRITLFWIALLLTSAVGRSQAVPQQQGGASTTGVPTENDPLVVLTYNIRYDTPADGVNSWPNRRTAVAELLSQRYRPDLIGIQEALLGQILDLASDLEDYSWVGLGRDDGWQQGEFAPVFYRKDRLQLLQTNTFWLSETPEIPGSISWDAAITRIVSWAKLRDKLSGKDFYFFNTHFDHLGVRAREESATLIRLRISEIAADQPVILAGDFNFPEASPAYGRLAGVDFAGLVRLYDCRYRSKSPHEGPTASFHGWKQLGPPESRIDYIFVNSRFQVWKHRIIDDRQDGRFPSDHLPVLAEVVLEP